MGSKGHFVQAFTDVALHWCTCLGRNLAQSLQQLWGAGWHKSWGDDWLDQSGLEIPACI